MQYTSAVRESLRFDVDVDSAPEEYRVAITGIKSTGENLLFHFKKFEIRLPESIIDGLESSVSKETKNGEEASKSHIKMRSLSGKLQAEFEDTESPNVSVDVDVTVRDGIKLTNLFIAPTFDELEQVARDERGQLKRLSAEQLKQLRQKGEFEVESRQFAGQKHVWRLTRLLQKGTSNTNDSLLSDCAKALRFIVICARDRLAAGHWSARDAFIQIGRAVYQLVDALFGLPHWTNGDLEIKMDEERLKYAVAELDVLCPAHREKLARFVEFVASESSSHAPANTEELPAPVSEYKVRARRVPPIAHAFKTPTGTLVDLRLFNINLAHRCKAIIERAIAQANKLEWFDDFVHRLIVDLKKEKIPNSIIAERVANAAEDEYFSRLFEALRNDERLSNTEPDIADQLIEACRASRLRQRVVDMFVNDLNKAVEKERQALRTRYPLRSRMWGWVERQINVFQKDYIAKHRWDVHREFIRLAQAEHLNAAAYFVQRDLVFLQDREQRILRELRDIRYPTRIYVFRGVIWRSRNYRVFRYENGAKQRLTTQLVTDDVEIREHTVNCTKLLKEERIQRESAASARAARQRERPSASASADNSTDEDSDSDSSIDSYVRYTVQTRNALHSTSKRFGWRWWNMALRTYTGVLNAFYMFFVFIPWFSSVSLRAAFASRCFTNRWRLCEHDGALVRDDSVKVRTTCALLSDLWTHVSISRMKFESAPDTGLIGRSATRWLNCIWNYVVKGVCGSLLIVTVKPLVCLVCSTASLALAVTVPIWVPVVSAAVFFFNLLVFDLESPEPKRMCRVSILMQAAIYRFALRGLVVPLGSCIFAFTLCPLLAAIFASCATVRYLVRSMWDSVMFALLIKRRARVPVSNSFMARRVRGPGLASEFHYQVRPEQVLLALEAQLERIELESWKSAIERILNSPLIQYRRLAKFCFAPFGAQLVARSVQTDAAVNAANAFEALCFERDRYAENLKRLYSDRAMRLAVNIEQVDRVRLTEQNLKTVLIQGEALVKRFVTERLFPLLRSSAQKREPLDQEETDYDAVEADLGESDSEADSNQQAKEALLRSTEESDEFDHSDGKGSVQQGALPAHVRSFWRLQQLRVNDWRMLTQKLLVRAFHSNILQPLDSTEMDATFKLETRNIDLSSYLSMVQEPEKMRDDLDLVDLVVYSSKDDPHRLIQIDPPRCDVSRFMLTEWHAECCFRREPRIANYQMFEVHEDAEHYRSTNKLLKIFNFNRKVYCAAQLPHYQFVPYSEKRTLNDVRCAFRNRVPNVGVIALLIHNREVGHETISSGVRESRYQVVGTIDTHSLIVERIVQALRQKRWQRSTDSLRVALSDSVASLIDRAGDESEGKRGRVPSGNAEKSSGALEHKLPDSQQEGEAENEQLNVERRPSSGSKHSDDQLTSDARV